MPGVASPAVAVVVCAYTSARLPLLTACLREARRQADAPGDEVVLVVDHDDELLAAAPAAVPAGVRVVPSTGPRGLSGARNSGVAATRADVVLFVDDDAVLRPGAVRALRERFADPAVTAVGGAVHPSWEGGAAPAWFPPEFGWVVGCDYTGLPPDGAQLRNPIGACMAVRRGPLMQVGGFSAALGRVGTLPAGCEETLMGIELRARGGVIVRDSRVAVDHHVPRARQDVRYLLRRCFHEGASKAVLARRVGGERALASERSYVRTVLTRALARDVRAAARRERGAVGRALLVPTGLVVTGAGLLLAPRSRPARRRTAVPAAAEPAAVRDEGPGPDRDAGARVGSSTLVSVIVCTLGRTPHLRATVAAVLAQTHANLELVVVDNDPASGATQALLADVHDPRLRVVAEPARGLSAARNAGLAAARGPVVAYTDDDAAPEPGWLTALVAVFARDADRLVTCVTGRVLAGEIRTREQAWFEEAGVFDKGPTAAVWALDPAAALHLGVAGPHSPFFPYTAGELGSGNNMAFRTTALRALGGFDEALGAGTPARGGEDLDVFRRVVLADGVLVYTPDAVVRHQHRETYDALRRQLYGYGVGMGAVLTKILLRGGRPALAVARCIPIGVHMLLAPGSPKNAKVPVDMPRALVRAERLGYVAGPPLYLASALAARRRRAGTGPA